MLSRTYQVCTRLANVRRKLFVTIVSLWLFFFFFLFWHRMRDNFVYITWAAIKYGGIWMNGSPIIIISSILFIYSCSIFMRNANRLWKKKKLFKYTGDWVCKRIRVSCSRLWDLYVNLNVEKLKRKFKAKKKKKKKKIHMEKHIRNELNISSVASECERVSVRDMIKCIYI